MTVSKIRMAMAAMTDPDARPEDIARELGVTTTTLYAHVNGDGSAKAAAESVPRRPARPQRTIRSGFCDDPKKPAIRE